MSAPFSTASLHASLHAKNFPTELHDMILTFTFTAPPGPMDLTYHRPSLKLLHISPATRTLFAKNFYNREFIFRANLFMSCIPPFFTFLDSIDARHVGFLRRVTFRRNGYEGLESDEYLDWVVRSCKGQVRNYAGVVVEGKIVYELPSGDLSLP